MSLTIAITGKGGTGKTTLAALFCRALLDRAIKPLLAVDADPNSCLPERLGITVTRVQTIGYLREQLRAEPESVPYGFSKTEWIEKLISEEMTEAIGFDLIVMGRQEGPNCYCYINNLLRGCLERLEKQYRATIIDNEAGLEHLSRRTNGHVDTLLVVCEPTFNGARTALRIREIIEDLKLDVQRACLVLNRSNGVLASGLREEFDATGMEIAGIVPEDEVLNEYEAHRKSLLELPRESNAFQAVEVLTNRILERISS